MFLTFGEKVYNLIEAFMILRNIMSRQTNGKTGNEKMYLPTEPVFMGRVNVYNLLLMSI